MRIKVWKTFLEAPLITKTSVLVRTAFQSCAKGIFNGTCFILRKAFLDLFNIVLSHLQEISECHLCGMIWKIVCVALRMNRCLYNHQIERLGLNLPTVAFPSDPLLHEACSKTEPLLRRNSEQTKLCTHKCVCICICNRYL